METLPLIYSIVVFVALAAVFFILGRILLHAEVEYDYTFDSFTHHDQVELHAKVIQTIQLRSSQGWKLEEILDTEGAVKTVTMIFVKTRTRYKFK